MATLTAADMQRLEHDARGLAAEEGGRRYLAEALGCLQEMGEPCDVLELLRAMWPTGSKQQQQQRRAINAVGQWIVRRIQRTPAIAAEDMARELGWLRRMVQYHEKVDRQQKHALKASTGPPPARSRKPVTEPDFAQILPALRRHRAAALDEQSRAAARQRRAAQSAAIGPSAVPGRLPDVFAVDFADIQAVRDARRAARKRSKQGRPPKDRLLALRPVDAQLVPLAGNLTCSLLHTENLDAVFAAMDTAGGVSPAFYIAVADIREQGDAQAKGAARGARLLRRVFLDQASARLAT